jgi:phospholipid/cholesterol/gamma-HCH transport system substrate-binding protein
MMEYRSLELKVGFTVFIAILVFSVGMMWLEGFKLQGERYTLHAVFPMVGGVDRGDAVNVNGVERGEVTQVRLREHDVIVTMSIDVETRIPADSKVLLQTQGIMGERIVTIRVGRSEVMLEPDSMVEGVYDPGISEALASMGKVMEDLHWLTADMREIAEVLRGKEIATTLKNLAEASEEITKVIRDLQPDLRRGAAAMSSSAVRADSMMARNEERFDSIMVNLDRASAKMPALAQRLDELSVALRDVTERLRSTDNTLGTLLNDKETLYKLESAITNLDSLVTDIKANPKKYLKVEVF